MGQQKTNIIGHLIMSEKSKWPKNIWKIVQIYSSIEKANKVTLRNHYTHHQAFLFPFLFKKLLMGIKIKSIFIHLLMEI